MGSEVPKDDCAVERGEDLRRGLICEAAMAGCANAPRDARTISIDNIAHRHPLARNRLATSSQHYVLFHNQAAVCGGRRGGGPRRHSQMLNPHIASTTLAVSDSALTSPVYPIHRFPSRPKAAPTIQLSIHHRLSFGKYIASCSATLSTCSASCP